MVVELRDVWFRYPGSGSWTLRGVSLEVRRGDFVVITGHNGSGKTTLLKVLSLIYRPTRGKVIVGGADFWEMSEMERTAIRRAITYVHEKPVMLRGSVLHNIVYGLTLRGLTLGEAIEVSRGILEELGIWEYRHANAYSLSSGQAQLVALARALVLDPEVLVLDEPLANLDRTKKEAVMKALARRVGSRTAVVMTSHDVGYVKGFGATRLVLMEDGRAVEMTEATSV